MRMWSWIAAAFVILVLQTTSLGFFGGNLFFDLPLLFIYSIGLFYGARAGLLCGLAFGLLQDISSPGVFGFCLLTRGLTGYGIGCIKEMIFKNNYGYHVLIIGGLSLLLRVLYAILAERVWDNSPFPVPSGFAVVLPGKYAADITGGPDFACFISLGRRGRCNVLIYKTCRKTFTVLVSDVPEPDG